MAALNREEPDRVPRCELVVDRALAERLMGWPKKQADYAGTSLKDPYTVDEAKAVASYLELDNITFILRAPTFAHMKVGTDGRLFPAEGMIKTDSDLSMMEFADPYSDELYAEAEVFVKNKGEYAACFVTRIGLIQTMLNLGMENFSLALYDNRDLVEKQLDMYCEWLVVVAERVCQMGFDLFWTADDFAFKTGLFFSPELFRKLMLPRYQLVLEKVTIPWLLHSDGDIKEVVDMLLELGVAGLHPIENGAMDIRAMKRKYGDRLCLMGNVDMHMLAMGTPKEVDREVRELIRDLAPGGGYIVSSGNSLASYLKPDCVLALTNAVKKYGTYPIELT
jgi:uroporphyrinogen decarboxylase